MTIFEKIRACLDDDNLYCEIVGYSASRFILGKATISKNGFHVQEYTEKILVDEFFLKDTEVLNVLGDEKNSRECWGNFLKFDDGKNTGPLSIRIHRDLNFLYVCLNECAYVIDEKYLIINFSSYTEGKIVSKITGII